MKQTQIMIAFFAGAILMATCTKPPAIRPSLTPTDTSSHSGTDTTGADTIQVKPAHYDLYINVLEYQTNIPLASAAYTKVDCAASPGPGGCPGQGVPVASWTSDANGIIFIKGFDTAGGIANIFPVVSKARYFDRWSLDSLYGNDSVKHAVVHLYPRAWLRIHIKNQTYQSATRNIIFRFDPGFTPAHDAPEYMGASESYFPWFQYRLLYFPETSFDSTFLIPTCAFAGNEIAVFEGTDNHNDQIQLFNGIKTVGKLDTLAVDLVF